MEVTIDHVEDMLQKEVLIAETFDARTGDHKRLVYTPFYFLFTVRYTRPNDMTAEQVREAWVDGLFVTPNPYEALEKYNAITIQEK